MAEEKREAGCFTYIFIGLCIYSFLSIIGFSLSFLGPLLPIVVIIVIIAMIKSMKGDD